MKKIVFFASLLCLFSCSKEIKDGPHIYFSNLASIPDTIEAKTIVPFDITAIGNGYKVTRAQLFVNKTEFFDTSFSAKDSINIHWEMDFSGRTRTQNITIQATDENEMIATQTLKLFVK
ncbi:MAG: hypothetical protein MJ204_01670 [Bacteroidales bacterium]|nr:hypothetical protein [Bacteroidales bacterium]